MRKTAHKFRSQEGLHGWEYRGFKIYRDDTVKPIHPNRYFVFGLGRQNENKYVQFFQELQQAKKAIDNRIESEMHHAAEMCRQASELFRKDKANGKN